MESIKKYTLTVFNTCTQEYEEVSVTEEVYSAIDSNQYETIRLRKLFSKHEFMTELDAELLQSSVSAILCYRDGTMDIQLKNHQIIGRSETV